MMALHLAATAPHLTDVLRIGGGYAVIARLNGLLMVAVFATARFLVTGATGFIGRRLVAHLVERYSGRSVTCLVHHSQVSADNNRYVATVQMDPSIHIISGDLTNRLVTSEPPPAADIVFHLAANIETSASEAEARVNDEGTANLIDWLGDDLAGRRLVYASSVAVCDRSGRADGPLDESSPCRPRTNYGRTKLRGEQIVRRMAEQLHFTYTILRFPTVYGSGQKPDGMFDTLLRYAATGAWLGRLNWPGRTSILHVEDAARMMIDVAGMPEAANHTFSVASDESLTVGQIARRLGDLTGHPVAPIDLPSVFWFAVRWAAWNRAVATLMPPFSRVAHWRLGLIADDGFWQSGARLRQIYPRPLITLDEGVKLMLDAAASRNTADSAACAPRRY